MRFQNISPNDICICIPARYASSRFPGKLLCKIDGQSVLERTCRRALECKMASQIFILTDHETISNAMKSIEFGDRVTIVLNTIETRNGTERIGKNLKFIPEKYKLVVNIQGDEPFVDSRNVDYVIKNHIAAHQGSNEEYKDIFFSTLHQQIDDMHYLQQTSCVKIIVSRKNNAMLYSRNIIPWNKDGVVRSNTKYYSCTGLYVYNRERLEEYNALEDTEHQIEEDVEQMKVLEHGFTIKSFECPHYNEISVNTVEDYKLLCSKYGLQSEGGQSPVSSISGTASESAMETV